jgi:hypothetical protein
MNNTVTSADLILGFTSWLAHHRTLPRDQAHSVISAMVDIVREEEEAEGVESLAYLADLGYSGIFERAFGRVISI